MASVGLLLLFGLVHPYHGIVLRSWSNDTTLMSELERSFNPTDQDRELETAAIMKTMTTDSALKVIENCKVAPVPHALIASVHTVLSSSGVSRGSLRAASSQPDVSQTKKMLNDMLFQSLKKYDLEQAKCSNYYAKQCAEMESCRGEISAASGAAAACKAKTLSAQGEVDKAQKELPKLTLQLSQHTQNCDKEINATKSHLKRVNGDISVMTSILKMTDCKKASMLNIMNQTKSLGLLHCKTECAAKAFASFENHGLREKVGELESPAAQKALQDALLDLAGNSNSGPILELMQDGTLAQQDPEKKKSKKKVEKMKIAKKPAPRTQKPADPCEDPNAGAPSSSTKRAAKCTMSKSPNCNKMQSRFLFIQAGMMDERDSLKEQLSDLEKRCETNEKTLSTQVEQEETRLKDEQTKLAEATSCESTASEKGRLVSAQYKEIQGDMAKMQKTCQANFQSLLSEQCGLRKIRGEVLRLSGIKGSVQDCKLGKWEPGQCSAKCGGGSLVLTRSIMMPEQGGAPCLPLQQNRSCNDSPCPIDCKVGKWSKWSRCSAECGGGVTQRARDVEVHMRYGGKPCGQTTQAKACNAHACDKDCELKAWTKWSKCSKQCDGGTKKRARFIKSEALGEGKCADASDKTRLQYKKCNYKPCKKSVRKGKPTLQCKTKLDVILLLDGSSDMGSKGWSKTVEAAKLFVSSFQDGDSRVAVLTFSGPSTWSGVSKCMGEVSQKESGPVDMAKDCQISWASKFTGDMEKLTATLDGLSWPKGGSLTSLALSAAENELQLARKDARPIVVVVTDGRPLSFRRTGLAADRIKESARLVWVPVSKFGPLEKFKLWASKRWQENVVKVSSYKQLAKAESIDHIIANICPEVDGGVPGFKEAEQKKLKKMYKKTGMKPPRKLRKSFNDWRKKKL